LNIEVVSYISCCSHFEEERKGANFFNELAFREAAVAQRKGDAKDKGKS
jgi:hypothetical protein